MTDTNPNLDYIKPTRKTGGEPFSGTNGQDCNVLEFWQWSASDLMSNATRGIFAEYIVAKALGIDTRTTVRDEWAVYDLMTPDGITIEVKSSGYLQAWKQKDYSTPTFSIAPAVGWDGKSGESEDGPSRRHADVYVFCLFKYQGTDTPNPLDLNQWEFYVVPTRKLNDRDKLITKRQRELHGEDAPEYVSRQIGLTELRKLAERVTWGEVRSKI